MKHRADSIKTHWACWAVLVVFCQTCWEAATAAPSANWDRFRGPNGQGIAESAQPPIEFAREKNMKWRVPVPEAYSSVVVWDDRVFLSGLEGDSLAIVRLKTSTGQVEWKQVVEGKVDAADYQTGNGHRASSTPAVDGQHLVVYSYHRGLLAYDHGGKQLWERKLPPPQTLFCPATSPVIHEGRVYLCLDGGMGADAGNEAAKASGSKLHAFDLKDGSLVWETARPFGVMSYSTPVIWKRENQSANEELVVFGGQRMAGYDLNSGEMKWWVGGFPRVSVSGPTLGGGMVFGGATAFIGFSSVKYEGPTWDKFMSYDKNGDGRLALDEIPGDFVAETRPELPRSTPGYAVFPMKELAQGQDDNKDGFFDKDEFARMIKMAETMDKPALLGLRPDGQGDLSDSAVVWRGLRAIPESPSPLYYRDRLYSVKDGGILVCYKPLTGEVVYQERLGAGGLYTASPVAASGRLYFCSAKGQVIVVEAGDQLQVLSRNQVDEEIYGTPALAGRTFYLRTLRHLYAFESPGER